MKRLFTFLSFASLLLCVAMCLLWVRSYWVEEELTCAGPHSLWSLAASRGAVHYYRERVADPTQQYEEHEVLNPFGFRHVAQSPPGVRDEPLAAYGRVHKGINLRLGSLCIMSHDGSAEPFPTYVVYTSVPCWLVMLALLVCPLLWTLTRR